VEEAVEQTERLGHGTSSLFRLAAIRPRLSLQSSFATVHLAFDASVGANDLA